MQKDGMVKKKKKARFRQKPLNRPLQLHMQEKNWTQQTNYNTNNKSYKNKTN